MVAFFQTLRISASNLTVCLVWLVMCATTTAQSNPQAESISPFEVSGRVIAKTKYGFEVRGPSGQIVEITVDEATEFALRMASPWFDGNARKVYVDGQPDDDGQPVRISYDLPAGRLWLLAQFRSPTQRDRMLNQSPWRLNYYLISDQPIEENKPTGNDLLLAGELDVEKLELIIGGKRFPINPGYRGATLAGRSIADLVPDQTVVLVSGSQTGETRLAETILFRTDGESKR